MWRVVATSPLKILTMEGEKWNSLIASEMVVGQSPLSMVARCGDCGGVSGLLRGGEVCGVRSDFGPHVHVVCGDFDHGGFHVSVLRARALKVSLPCEGGMPALFLWTSLYARAVTAAIAKREVPSVALWLTMPAEYSKAARQGVSSMMLVSGWIS